MASNDTGRAIGVLKMKIILALLFCSVARADFPTQPFDDSARAALRWSSNHDVAASSSDYLVAGLMFMPSIVAIKDKREWREVGGVVAAQAVAAGVTQLVKVSAKRVRPNGSDARSFFSGHTSAAFAGAAATCRLDKDYCVPGYALAVATAYLRMAADKHWFSDVFTGAIVGTASGRYIPGLVWGW